MKKQGLLLLVSAAGLGLAACATTYRVTPYPSDAKITLKNPISQEVFEIGDGKVEFSPKDEYGTAFVITASKKGFRSREIFVTPTPGSSTDYMVTLKADEVTRGIASLDDMESKIKKRVEDLMREAEENMRENMRRAEEDRRQAMMERVKAELERKNVESEKKIGVLERSFDVYKEALFSERYASGPASFDRKRIDTSVDYVNRVQLLIEERRFAEAEGLLDRLLEKDEYFAKGYALKGTVKLLQNKTNEAIVAWERAVTLDPNDKASQFQLSELYRKSGRVPASVNPLQDTLAPEPRASAPMATAPAAPAPLKIRDR
ncbi:MAG: hypothetical protein EOP11_03590 [Proteobacteria bacterium]|nr:MAG: hypothetical protein EOP11_03590 [Pseudomonadota bacterium]